MSLQTHLHRRGAIYYHRIRVPLDLASKLRRSELMISLRTSDPAVARQRGHSASVRAHQLFECVRSKAMLTQEQIQSLISEYYRDLLAEDEIWRVENKPIDWKNDAAALEHLMQFFGFSDGVSDEEIEAALRQSGYTAREAVEQEYRSTEELLTAASLKTYDWSYVEPWLNEFLKKKGISLAPNSPEYSHLLIGFLRARNEVMRISGHRSNGNWTTEPQDPMFRNAHSTLPVSVGPIVKAAVERKSALITDVAEEFMAERRKGGVHPKYLLEMQTSFKWFIEYFGQPRSVADYSLDDLRDYKNALLEVPANFVKLLKVETIREAIAKNQARSDKLPTLNISSINGRRLGSLQAFFGWAEERRYITDNPAKNVYVKEPRGSQKRKKRDEFTIEQLNTIFHAPIYTGCESAHFWKKPGELVIKNHRYWLPLVALFTGGRKAELAQLDVNDVRELQGGIWCFNITDLGDDEKRTKNVYSNRIVPVHDELKKLGLLDYLAERRKVGEKKLFDADPGKNGQYDAFTKWFTHFRRSLGINGSRSVFHSFRHNFEQAMLDARISEGVRYALGGRTRDHSSEDYITSYKPDLLYEEISKVRYEGLDLTHLYR